MTIKAWCYQKDVSIKKAMKWIDNNWIPGVHPDENGEYDIPMYARVPYTQRRAKKDKSILVSICKACNSYLGICPNLYGMNDEEEFKALIQPLIDDNLLKAVVLDEVTYYNPTAGTIEYIVKNDRTAKKEVLETIRATAEAAAPIIKAFGEGLALYSNLKQ